MSAKNTLPLPCDEILVSFQLNDHENVWWSAVVEDIHVLKKGSRVLATATILYESAHSYPAERVAVSFLVQNIIRPDQSLESDAESSSWKYPSDEASGSENKNESDDDVPHTKKRKSNRIRKPAAAADSGVQVNRNAPPMQMHNMKERVQQNSENVERLWQDMSKRMQALERGLSQMRNCDHRTIIDERVKAIRVTVKVKLIEQIQRPLRLPNTRSNVARMGGVTRNSVSVQHSCDWDLFKIVARDVFERAAAKHVIFLPSYLATQNDGHDLDKFCIVFRSAWSLLEWLGIWSECEKRSLLVTLSTSRQGPSMRLLGGMQLVTSETQRPLNLFFGGSCITRMPANAECEDNRTVIQSPSGESDNSDNGLLDDLQVDNAQAAGLDILHIDSLNNFDTFSLTWSADSSASHKKARLIMAVGEGVRVGTLRVDAPSCGLFTNSLCAKVNSLLAIMDHSSFS